MKKIKRRYTKRGKMVFTWRDRLANKIRVEHAAVCDGLRISLTHARAVGLLLAEAKEKLGRGSFMPWVKQECGFSHSLANMYMRVARDWEHIQTNSERVANMSLGVLDRWLRHGSKARAANRPLTEVTQTVLGHVERISKEYPALQRKLETVLAMTNRLRTVILVLTEGESQSTITSLLTLRGHVDGVIAEVEQHVADFARTDVTRTS